MRKFLKFFLVLLVLFAGLISVFLQVLKPRLSDFTKEVLNNFLEAKVDYRGADISLFRAFPGVSITFHDLQVTTKSAESSDTLGTADRFSVAFDPLSVFSGELKVHSLRIERPKITVEMDGAGNNNWDIFSQAAARQDAQNTADFAFSLRDFKIKDGIIAFYDGANGNSVLVDGLNHEMKGRLSSGLSTLVTNNTVKSLSVAVGGVSRLQDVKASFGAEIVADLEKKKFILKDNRLVLNDLGLMFSGAVSLFENAIDTDLDFKAEKATLKEFLSLVPVVYERNYEKIDAEGVISLSGHVKGLYKDNQLPAFRLDLEVSNGNFGYKDVPVRVEEVDFKGGIENPGGSADKTVLFVPEFNLKVNGRPVIMTLGVSTPFSDPFFDMAIDGSIDLADVQRIFRIKDLGLTGDIRSDIVVKGRFSAFNAGVSGSGVAEAYGSVTAKGITIASEKFTPDVAISSAQLNLSPGYLDLVELRMKTGKSDFAANGRLENYIAYIMKKGKLTGTADVRSTFVQLDEFRNLQEEKMAVMLPDNLSMKINGTFDRVRFDDMLFEGVNGSIVLEEEKLDFNDINAETLGGKVSINGFYNTKGGKTDTDFSISATEMNIVRSYESLELLEKVAPVAEYAKGDVSAKLTMRSHLDDELKPVPESISGKGRVETKGLLVEDFPPIRKLALLLDVDALDTLRIPETAVDFAIDKGFVETAPFSFRVNDIRLHASGVTGFDKSLDWKIGLEIPRKYIGKAGSKTIAGLLEKLPSESMEISLPDTVVVDAVLKGSVTEPEIGLDLGKTSERIAARLKERMRQTIADELRGRFLPEQEGDIAVGDSGNVADILEKTAGDILFNRKGARKDSADTPEKEEGTLPSFIENIFAPSKKMPHGQETARGTSVTADSTKKSGGNDEPGDTIGVNIGVDSVEGKKSIIELFQ